MDSYAVFSDDGDVDGGFGFSNFDGDALLDVGGGAGDMVTNCAS